MDPDPWCHASRSEHARPLAKGSSRWIGWGAACLLLFVTPVGRAQESDPEITRLRAALAEAQREIEALRQENALLKARLEGPVPSEHTPLSGEAVRVPSTGTPGHEPPRESTRPVPQAPTHAGAAVATTAAPATTATTATVKDAAREVSRQPIGEGEVVTADQLLADYQADPAGADARYRHRRFRLEGTPSHVARTFVEGVWRVQIRGTRALGSIRCQVSLDGNGPWRLNDDGAVVGRLEDGSARRFLREGYSVILEGTCDGLRGDSLIFRNCRLAD